MSLHPDLILGVDCSTTSSKAILWDTGGTPVAEGRASLPMFTPHPLWHEQPADQWWSATCSALRQATAAVDPRRIAALCITHQRETFVPVDDNGHPLRPAILWMDERAGGLLPDLQRQLGAQHFHQVTGKPLSGNLSLVKIAWLRQFEPQVYQHTRRYLDVHAFLVHRLTGQYHTGWGCADPTGLFDMAHNDWSPEILSSVGLTAEQFPAAFPAGQIIGQVTDEAARLCGLPAGLPVVAGLGDGQAAGLGVGVTDQATSYLSLGTSTISGTLTDHYTTSLSFRTLYAGIPGMYSLETVILSGAYTLDWFIRHLAGIPPETLPAGQTPASILEREAQAVPPGAEGLLLVPFWNSAMDPHWDAKASGIIVGWRGVHTRAHVYRAILEGIAFEKRLQISGVERSLGKQVERFIAVGGGAHSELWRQIIADIIGKPVLRARSHECAALGAAILGAAAAGLYPGVPQAAQAMTHTEPGATEPHPQQHAYYSRLYNEVYCQLYPALRQPLQKLADLAAHA